MKVLTESCVELSGVLTPSQGIDTEGGRIFFRVIMSRAGIYFELNLRCDISNNMHM